MSDRRIEEILIALENCEISDDGMESDGEDIPYYPTRESLIRDPEDDINDNCEEAEDTDNCPDPPLFQEDLLPVRNSPIGTCSQPAVLTNARNLIWRKQSLIFDESKTKFEGTEELHQDITELDTPYQFFKNYFTDDFLQAIVDETVRYSIQQRPDRPEQFTITDLRKYLGILIFMSVYNYPNTRSYWHNKFGFQPIREAMSVNTFEKIRKILHFNNNADHLPVTHPQHDKLHKLRPIIDHLNQKFASVTIEQRLSIDEQMCSTKIGHFLKQYLPNKPHKWGFKLFVLCNLMGYAYKFIIYSGKETNDRVENEQGVGVVGQTVLNLLRVVPRHRNHIVYFDNYCTSLPLMYQLAKEGIQSLGTIQRNRLGKSCKLPNKQEVMKTTIPRGTFDEYVTNYEGVDITTVSWKDNKQVVLASTYVGAQPVETIERYDKKEKRRIKIDCPKIIKEYNAHMGGVDLMDSHLGRYKIRIKSRKWYIRIFYHLLDLTVINSWVLYKKALRQKGVAARNIYSLAEFRAELADVLCKYTPNIPKGRPSTSSLHDEPQAKIRRGKPCQVIPAMEIRLDNSDHNLIRSDGRGRCMLPACSLLSTIKCSKCNVFLCSKKSKDCFSVFHNSVKLANI